MDDDADRRQLWTLPKVVPIWLVKFYGWNTGTSPINCYILKKDSKECSNAIAVGVKNGGE